MKDLGSMPGEPDNVLAPTTFDAIVETQLLAERTRPILYLHKITLGKHPEEAIRNASIYKRLARLANLPALKAIVETQLLA